MNNLGWKRVRDKTDETVRLRWCELKSTINYAAFKEGLSGQLFFSAFIFAFKLENFFLIYRLNVNLQRYH